MSEHINLNDILRDERKTRSKLLPLDSDFYEKVALKIRELEEEKKKNEDTYSTKYAILEDELRTARKAIESIIERRTAKIINLASLSAPSKQKEKQELDSMTREEREFYNKLLLLMIEYRGEQLDKILSKKERPPSPPEPPIQPPRPQENKLIEAPSEGKKHINKEYIVVRLLKDVPTFVGVDGRNYTLAKEDVVVLSAVNARALINRNAAIQISVKR